MNRISMFHTQYPPPSSGTMLLHKMPEIHSAMTPSKLKIIYTKYKYSVFQCFTVHFSIQ